MPSEPESLRVLIADERKQYLEVLAQAVEALGHQTIAHEIDIAHVGIATHEHRPDIAIVALHEDTEHALDLITEIVEEATCPVLALADAPSADFVSAAAERGVFAYLDSTEETELRGGIDVAITRYREYTKLLSAFERRARIERAKGILMERHSLDDRAAFERLRGEARSSRRQLIEVVEEMLAAEPA